MPSSPPWLLSLCTQPLGWIKGSEQHLEVGWCRGGDAWEAFCRAAFLLEETSKRRELCGEHAGAVWCSFPSAAFCLAEHLGSLASHRDVMALELLNSLALQSNLKSYC